MQNLTRMKRIVALRCAAMGLQTYVQHGMWCQLKGTLLAIYGSTGQYNHSHHAVGLAAIIALMH